MDIEEFYDADERRRKSVEVEFGRDWQDDTDIRSALSWVQDTGELYFMREPLPAIYEDALGDMQVEEEKVSVLTVTLLGVVDSHERVEEILTGWPDAMAKPGGVAWVSDRLRAAGVTPPPEG